jgi:16S rRNA (adenine1518-N6/adenine1519-N6)-dimethyltransferase
MRQPLGQHFLRDPKTIHTIVSAAELSRQETALEIGPGKGVLTSALVGKVKKLIAVELDSALASRLAAQWASESAVQIVHGDFLRQDLDALVPGADRPVKLLGNLPYSITSPIFEKILAWPHWETGVFLIQKEVAERMRSAEGSRVYGILSLAVQLFATVESLLTVGPGAFQPPPEVDSSVVRLRRKPRPEVAADELPAFFDLVHGAFAHRRKTLGNSLALHTGVDKKKVENWLRAQEISPSLRAEMLALRAYARLTAPWRVFRRENTI